MNHNTPYVRNGKCTECGEETPAGAKVCPCCFEFCPECESGTVNGRCTDPDCEVGGA